MASNRGSHRKTRSSSLLDRAEAKDPRNWVRLKRKVPRELRLELASKSRQVDTRLQPGQYPRTSQNSGDIIQINRLQARNSLGVQAPGSCSKKNAGPCAVFSLTRTDLRFLRGKKGMRHAEQEADTSAMYQARTQSSVEKIAASIPNQIFWS